MPVRPRPSAPAVLLSSWIALATLVLAIVGVVPAWPAPGSSIEGWSIEGWSIEGWSIEGWSIGGPSVASAQCIDEAIRDELNARRRYRGVRERLFQKAGRFEVSVMGGVYAADLLSATYLLQGGLTYHVTEDIGLEASFAYSRAESELVRVIEQDRGITLIRLDAPVYVYQAHLLWTIAYGKMRWFGADIGRFDLNVAIGGGITDNQTSRGLTGSFGVGVKFFFGEWFAVRIDIRDQILEQELLGESAIVNNLTATLGLSIFIPFES